MKHWVPKDALAVRVESERQFSMASIAAQHEEFAPYVQKELEGKIQACRELVDLETRLLGIYSGLALTMEQLGLAYRHQGPQANAMANSVYISTSCILLIEHGLYGSSKVLLRQFLEMLLTAKTCLYHENLRIKWEQPPSEEKRDEIRIHRDVFKKHSWRDFTGLKAMWHELNEATHHTRAAQQPLLWGLTESERAPIPMPEVRQGMTPEQLIDEFFARASKHPVFRRRMELRGNCEYALDILFMLLDMNSHLLAPHLRRQTRPLVMYYLGSDHEAVVQETAIRERMKALTRDYWSQNKRRSLEIYKPFRQCLLEFKADWMKGSAKPQPTSLGSYVPASPS